MLPEHVRSLGILAIVTLVAAPAVWSAPRAQTGDGVRIGIIDVQRVFTDAKAAKSVRGEMDNIRRQFQEDVRAQERKLRDSARQLMEQKVLLSEQEFSRRRRALEDEGRRAQTAVRERKQKLDRAFSRTRNVIMKDLVAVTRDLRKSRDIDIVLEKRDVFLAVSTLDLTPEIIKLLDKRLPKVALQLDDSGSDKGKEKGKR